MKKFLLVISILAFSCSFAQKGATATENITANDSLQIKVDLLYEKLILSQSYDEMERAQKAYLEKVHFKIYGEEMLDSGDMNAWVKKNLDKTVFKDSGEADREYSILSKAIQACSKENSSYFNMLPGLFSTDEGVEVWHRAIMNIARKYPEKFEPDPLEKMRRRLLGH